MGPHPHLTVRVLTLWLAQLRLCISAHTIVFMGAAWFGIGFRALASSRFVDPLLKIECTNLHVLPVSILCLYRKLYVFTSISHDEVESRQWLFWPLCDTFMNFLLAEKVLSGFVQIHCASMCE